MQNASIVGLPCFQIMGFSTKEEILDLPESNFDRKKKKLTSNLTQMAKPNRKWSSPSDPSMWQDQPKEKTSLNTHFLIILICFLLHFINNGDNIELRFGRISTFFHGPQRHNTPFLAKVCLPLSLSSLFFSKFKGKSR